MMVLAQRKGQWMLAAFAPHLNGCNLSTNARPWHDADRFHLWQGKTYVWSNAPIAGVTFYPEIRYKGMRVYPMCWKRDTEEPILQLMGSSGGPGYPANAGPGFDEMLKAEGWQPQAGDPMLGFVHVDDLEKTEGPPPKGTF